jgi:hypothetical protein
VKPVQFGFDKAIKRIWTGVVAIAPIFLGVGIIQFNLIVVKVPGAYVQRWGATFIGVVMFAISIYVIVFEIAFPWMRKRKALRELRQQVSVKALLAHYRNRPSEIGNPVVLSCLRCDVRAKPGEYPRDLEFQWNLEGTNTSDSRLGALELTIAGTQGTDISLLDANCFTESVHGQLNTRPLSIKDKTNSKRVRLPFAGSGPDTGETFKCQLRYTWPKLLCAGCDYFFFETSNFGHTVNHIDFSFVTDADDYHDLYLYQIDLEYGRCSFLGSGQFDKCTGEFRGVINKPSNACVYVLLLKS